MDKDLISFQLIFESYVSYTCMGSAHTTNYMQSQFQVTLNRTLRQDMIAIQLFSQPFAF